MSDYKPSTPFPNGSTFAFFNDNFCCRCKKYKLDGERMPLPENCEVENAIAAAQFDLEQWPKNDIVQVGDVDHVCLRFESDNQETMKHYKALFEQEGA